MKTQNNHYIPDEEWEVIVNNVPIVSVDLVINCETGIVLGKRQNKPAKNEWFVPGGRVHKHEPLKEAVHRVAKEELNIEVEITEYLGVYEHFYETSDVSTTSGKHYIANGFVVKPTSEVFELDEQHSQVHLFSDLPQNLHRYIKDYIDDCDADMLNINSA